jgi:hypothetical protein
MPIPKMFQRSWFNACELARMGAVCGWMAGCGGSETTDESGGGATDAGDQGSEGPVLPGDVVQCCWLVTYGAALPCNAATCYSYAEEACLPPGNGTPCVERESVDVDGDGVIGIVELQTACGQVCRERGYDGTLPVDASGLLPTDGVWDDPAGFVWNCSEIGTINSSVVDANGCTPEMFPGPPPFHIPTHLGLTLKQHSSDQLQLNVLGSTLRPHFDAKANLALFDCSEAGFDGGTCTLQLEGLSLTLAEPIAVGDTTISSAELVQAGVVEATVRFAHCSRGTCTGHFQLGEKGGNPVGLGLAWVERHEPTRRSATHFVPLSNGSAGFGGVSPLDGLVSIDPSSQTGTLVLQGSGRDTFGGGAFASALFRFELQLAPRMQ